MLLRQFIDQYVNIKNVVGSIYQLRLVIDTNIVISDLLWLVGRDIEDARPSILEVIQAGTLIAYAPEHLRKEVEENLHNVSKKRKVSLDSLQIEWASYQKHLNFFEVDDADLEFYKDSVDPDDAPFVVLSKILGVPGVISDDSHIEKLGGNRIHVDIRLALRDYSRAAAIVYSIRLGGVLFTAVSMGTIIGLVRAISAVVKGVAKLPDQSKLILLSIITFIFISPNSRKYILNQLSNLKTVLGNAWVEIEPLITQLILEEQKKKEEANLYLEEIQEHISENISQDA